MADLLSNQEVVDHSSIRQCDIGPLDPDPTSPRAHVTGYGVIEVQPNSPGIVDEVIAGIVLHSVLFRVQPRDGCLRVAVKVSPTQELQGVTQNHSTFRRASDYARPICQWEISLSENAAQSCHNSVQLTLG